MKEGGKERKKERMRDECRGDQWKHGKWRGKAKVSNWPVFRGERYPGIQVSQIKTRKLAKIVIHFTSPLLLPEMGREGVKTIYQADLRPPPPPEEEPLP